ncbi:MAG: c-type cytochrome [Ramlibacter sp.]
MKNASLLLAVLGSALLASCANPLRSRDLGNAGVPAETLAQQVCSNCHGTNGNSVSPNFPNLAGQTKPYLAAQLRSFKERTRRDPAAVAYMWGLTRSLTDAQIDALAAYYAAQPARARPAAAGAASVEAGKQIYDHGVAGSTAPACAACHGVDAQGTEAAPRIAGQHAPYVARQLVVYRDTDERPDGAPMKAACGALGAQDIRDVAAFVQSRGEL